MKLEKNYRGSMTIEAAVVMPLIFALIGALIYMGIVMYQRVYLQSLANLIAERTAATWSSANKDIISGQRTAAQDKDSLYTALYDHEKSGKEAKLAKFCDEYMDKYSLLNSVSINKVHPRVDNYIFYRKVTVVMDAEYKIPGGGLFSLVGMNKNTIIISIKSEATVSDQIGFARNTDFIIETVNRLAEGSDVLTGYNKLLEKLNDVVDSLDKFTSQGTK